MHRVVTPELLDSLDVLDAEAQRSRRDLRRLNFLMGNQRWLHRELSRLVRPGECVLEIGAGDGGVDCPVHSGRHDGLDLVPRPKRWPKSGHWHQVGVERFDAWAGYDVVCGNLVFHHFPAPVLQRLGVAIRQHARVFLACEPLRSPVWHALFPALCTLLRASPVTRHDGRVSIAAGFRGQELAEQLGFTTPDWQWHSRSTRRGTLQLVAIRAEP